MLTSCAAGAVAALVAGCSDDDEQRPAPAAFAITATAEGKRKKVLEFPSTVKAGLVTMTLTNNDKVPRSARIVRLLGDHTVEDFRNAVEKEGAPIPEWIQDGGGVSTVLSRGAVSVTQVLAPGKYAIADDEQGEDGKSFADLGAKGEFMVLGPASAVELPARPATLTASDDGGGDEGEYGFEFKGLKAGPNEVRFENTGEQLHHALLFPIATGKTIKDVEAAFTADGPRKQPPPVESDTAMSTQVIDGGIAQNLTIYLQPLTNYAVICFIRDRKGGKPHVAKGMIEELKVGELKYE